MMGRSFGSRPSGSPTTVTNARLSALISRLAVYRLRNMPPQAVQIAEEIWVVHAFQKKSKQGIKTPQREIDVIKDRLKRLKEMLG